VTPNGHHAAWLFADVSGVLVTVEARPSGELRLRRPLADDTIATPLVLGHVSRLLAAVALSTFPNSATTGPTPHDRADNQPVLLRRASEFIDANVIEDSGLADIAEAVHVTARAVQYMFRRHLDTAPLRYLRDVRLHYAHEDLLIANRRQDTVTAIAARWGFIHTGRFRGLLPANLRPQPAHHAARLTWLMQLRGGAGLQIEPNEDVMENPSNNRE
jgi:AraC-like DNA-binding protein